MRKTLSGKPDSKLAIVVKGNPKYLDDPQVKPLAEAFYAEVEQILKARGYTVEFDPGEPYTSPRKGASVWIGHSRGIDRLRHAPPSVRTIALLTMDAGKKYEKVDDLGRDPDHYKLSPADRKVLDLL